MEKRQEHIKKTQEKGQQDPTQPISWRFIPTRTQAEENSEKEEEESEGESAKKKKKKTP